MSSRAEGFGTVLVVDDEEFNRELYGTILRSLGHDVSLASDGLEALAILETTAPDVVLLDYRMPLLEGPGVIRHMRATEKHVDTPVIMLTASAESHQIAAAFDAGADDYLVKPVDPRILAARVRATVVSRESTRRATEAAKREVDGRAFHEEMLSDLQDARAVQRAQLPGLPTTRGQVWFSGSVEPCGNVGGDLIDIVDLDDGATVAVLMDVAGHGTGAALVASAVRSHLRSLLTSHDLAAALHQLGRRLSTDGAGRHACVAAVRMRGASYAIVNAGLPPVWVGGRSEPRVTVTSSGPPPGLFEAKGYRVEEGTLQPDEVIVVVSDGLTEPFGFMDDVSATVPSLLRSLDDETPPTPRLLAERVRALFLGKGGQPDDATSLLIGLRS